MNPPPPSPEIPISSLSPPFAVIFPIPKILSDWSEIAPPAPAPSEIVPVSPSA